MRPGAEAGALDGPRGTGVIVGYYDDRTPVVHSYYAVTAKHVLSTAANIRVNTRNGATRLIDLDASEWTWRTGWEDVAVVDITDHIDTRDQVSYVPKTMMCGPYIRDEVGLNIGDDGFMLGLFVPNPGKERNAIAARFGNISMMADKTSPIKHGIEATGEVYNTPCFVFDIHSRPGFSGSPVFVYRTPEMDLRDIEGSTVGWRAIHRGLPGKTSEDTLPPDIEIVNPNDRGQRFLRLLGIHVSQFNDQIEIRKRKRNKDSEAGDPVNVGDVVAFPGSMTIVVPAWQILALIREEPRLIEQREKRWQKAKDEADSRSWSLTEEAAVEPESGADNPNHREDFTRLVGAASKPKPKGDRT